MRKTILPAAALSAALLVAPSAALACACGCQVFDVGGAPLMAAAGGGEAFLEFDYMNQTQNLSGTHDAPGADNDDKRLRSDFVVAGVQYMINQDWGVMAELPVTNRQFSTENDAGTAVDTFNHTAFGDVRLMGVYTGLSPDMSTGFTFGLKLPTGDWRYAGFDRDTSIGSGSTDLLFGGYHVGAVNKSGTWSWFSQGLFDVPVAAQGGYRPGVEFDGDVGISYTAWTSRSGGVSVSPVLQLLGSERFRDSGPEADPPNSGYGRLLISPGVQVVAGDWKLYGDVEFPVYQNVNGNQLVASDLIKFVVSRRF